MPNLKDFIAALQIGWFPALVALVGCSIVVAGDWFQLPYLSTAPEWLVTTAVTIGVFAFSILAANLAYAPVWIFRNYRRKKFHNKIKEKMLQEISTAPPEEIAILAYLVTMGRKAFCAEYTDRRLAPLVSKGIIRKLGGTHSTLEWPYIVNEDAWQFLLQNREQLYLQDASTMLDIFHYRSGW